MRKMCAKIYGADAIALTTGTTRVQLHSAYAHVEEGRRACMM